MARPKKVICSGDRHWRDKNYIELELAKLPSGSTIIVGDCRGADALVAECAVELGHECWIYEAEWNTYGRGAGPIRNQAMIDENPDADLFIAFHDNVKKSKGTRDAATRAKKAGIPTRLCKHARR
jgi:hypothetical protein